MTVINTTRGERNNNPCNIRIGPTPWLGKVIPSMDDTFEQFQTPLYGIRAGAMNVLHYYKHQGLATVEAIINKWAPNNENDTGSYVNDVAIRMGVEPDENLVLCSPTILSSLISAIIFHENGKVIYDAEVILSACSAAIASVTTPHSGV